MRTVHLDNFKNASSLPIKPHILEAFYFVTQVQTIVFDFVNICNFAHTTTNRNIISRRPFGWKKSPIT